MINLMYIVLMAMLALNVSSDVLKGFALVSDKLNLSTQNVMHINDGMYKRLAEQMKTNPEKIKPWYGKAQQVKAISDSLYNLIEELKVAIVRKSDGKNGDVNKIKYLEDTEAASYVMLNPRVGRGKELLQAVVNYRQRVTAMVNDSEKRAIILSNLNTDVPAEAKAEGKNWQEYMFENQPTVAAITLLKKTQNDVRTAESDVLRELIANIDVKDLRVNEVNAFVVPSSQTVVQGGRFQAQIFMAAVDTTNRPAIYINGQRLNNERGVYETVCSRNGDFTLNGYIEMVNGEGKKVRRDFQQKYSVIPPSAAVSADIMNVLYAGYDNPISVGVPGVPSSKLRVTMSGGGSFTQKGEGKFIARPTNVGSETTITVMAQMEGRTQEMGKFQFRVRKLPDPTAFIQSGDDHLLGGRISKQILMNTRQLSAAIDDGLLNIPFTVRGFEMVFFDNMGNQVPEVSQSAAITENQRNMIRQLSRGGRFFITKIRAQGPDGIERTLSGAMDIIVN